MHASILSTPHTGHLDAEIHGKPCSFDGDTWASSDSALAESLNLAAEFVPATHHSIQSRAELIIRRAGLSAVTRFTRVEFDTWKDGLPEGAID